ncbi:MAG: hypothetical protein QOG20_5681, partial [Pseudonocardiales bacterium]|nr:hypothetical protein [Pseudonocardiales bacterium]
MRRTARRIAAVAALTVATVSLTAAPAFAQATPNAEVPEPTSFTSMFTAMATPDMVFNAHGVPTPGEAGATGTFDYRINSTDEIICYDITLRDPARRHTAVPEPRRHRHADPPGRRGQG